MGTRRIVTLVVAVLLLGGGAGALGVALAGQGHAPSPSSSAFGTTGPFHQAREVAPVASSAPPPTPAPASGPNLPPSLPTSIAIPSIGVSSPLQQLGLNLDGTLEVPQPGPLYNEAGWYRDSPTPGALGPSIILGHVDSAADGPSVFFRLGDLQPGAEVDVTRADGTVAVFTVSGVRQYPKDGFPTATVYGNTTFAALRLITCGGAFDSGSGHYEDNVVVFASLSSSRPVG